MNKQTYPIPEGCKAISMEIINNAIITTFEPEKVEFKKGDIITDDFPTVAILDSINADGGVKYIAAILSNDRNLYINDIPHVGIGTIKNYRISTDTEKQLLFDALAKENKAWDAEKMEIVELKYIPKVGDCVKLDTGINIYFFVEDETDKYVNSKYMVKDDSIENDRDYDKCGGYIKNSYDRIYTKITTEELQSEFNKLGYEYDFETHEAKKLRWKPKCGEKYYFSSGNFIIDSEVWWDFEYDKRRFEAGNCFQTEEAFNKFKDYILKYEPEKNN